ncbi:hypothetical protein [Pseudoroseicyclus aestuarii]|uniref:Uncharacterized protein n=1 Tax=Pseudoroseicyclus aestuarii TaxID=1795041 RepID=A0A318SQZ5_9RHOB|nr:hypothetical protein [Pseudoroseicyclus aestuarii]PYE84361.1 hypothetical protein DFP88_102159 [Pseudoroseicyclus aestuarii]
MTETADRLAFFLDETDLRGLHPGWPQGVKLVLCVEEAASQAAPAFVLYHEDEVEQVLRRVSDVLDRPAGSFAVVPEVEGHPTRRVLYSEEQQLLAHLAANDRLGELAQDYLINYRFALEEGLDPAQVTLAPQRPVPTDRADPRPAERPEPPAPEPEVESAWAPLGARDGEVLYLEGRLTRDGDTVLLAIGPVTAQTPIVWTQSLAFREDFRSFLLPPDLARGAEAQWIGFPADRLPPAMAALLERGCAARLTLSGRGLLVAPDLPSGSQAPAPALPAPATPKPASKRPRWAGLAAACVLAGVAGMATRLPAADVTQAPAPTPVAAE